MYAIQIKDLCKKYGQIIAVDNLTLEIRQGEIFSLLGINGAGKTTLIKMLSCITKPTSGDAIILGSSVTNSSEKIKEFIGVSPQQSAIAPSLTVNENLKLIAGIHGYSKEEQKKKVKEISERFGLQEIMDRRASQLSGGWQRRLSIAMALINDPKILFLDEPTLGLDVIARSELWSVIRSLKGRSTVILTTHYMEEAEALSDRIGIMKNGKLLTTGTADDMKTRTGTDKFEAAFVELVKEVEG